ncbi:SEC-C metal-binding domain-containing protein [uncultured Ruegeria sp.]|uniref:YecA family protein n=1 Tax=uncultured Ruegeria sp. TaxID=259304 RepID=UPI0026363556|nr:SEC-C metal-binding domain-containing protein [uncultured Ruegeria sp.]
MDQIQSRTEEECFQELMDLCGSPGFAHAIAVFCLRDNFISYKDQMTGELIADKKTPSRLVRTEIASLIGGLLGGTGSTELVDQAVIATYLEQAERLLEEIHQCMIADVLVELKPDSLPLATGEAIREAAFYATESAYGFQYKDFAEFRYQKDEQWLVENVGFTLRDAKVITDVIVEIQSKKARRQLESLRETAPALWTMLPAFELKPSEVAVASGLPEDTVKSFFVAFSCNVETKNEDFQSVTDFNVTSARPIICLETRYYLFQYVSLAEAVYECPTHWMYQDKAYRATASQNKGNFTETMTFDFLKRIFGKEHVFQNLDLYEGSNKVGEIDVYVSFGDYGIIVQCKSQKLTAASRSGNLVKIRKDFRLAIQEAYDQCRTCFDALKSSSLVVRDIGGNEVNLQKPERVFPVTAISDHFPALSIQVREFLTTNPTEGFENPFCVDLFTLDVLSELVPSPIRVLAYLERRSLYYDRVATTNELGVLGFFLKHNLWLESDNDFLNLDDSLASDIDAAMIVRRDRLPGKDTPEGLLTRFKDTFVGRVIDDVDRDPNALCVELGLSLLEMGEDGINDVEALVSQMAKRGRGDVTLPMENRSSGLTIHCNSDPFIVADPSLRQHMIFRKYHQKANKWLGLNVDPSTMRVRFGAYVRQKHVFDYRLEEMLASAPPMVKTSDVITGAAQRKIGRNETCPCGSGKKYKRCCGKG